MISGHMPLWVHERRGKYSVLKCNMQLSFHMHLINVDLQRARLVLAAKGIPYECININLKDKPEWFFELNPGGKVPVIEHPNGKVMYESAICCGRY